MKKRKTLIVILGIGAIVLASIQSTKNPFTEKKATAINLDCSAVEPRVTFATSSTNRTNFVTTVILLHPTSQLTLTSLHSLLTPLLQSNPNLNAIYYTDLEVDKLFVPVQITTGSSTADKLTELTSSAVDIAARKILANKGYVNTSLTTSLLNQYKEDLNLELIPKIIADNLNENVLARVAEIAKHNPNSLRIRSAKLAYPTSDTKTTAEINQLIESSQFNFTQKGELLVNNPEEYDTRIGIKLTEPIQVTYLDPAKLAKLELINTTLPPTTDILYSQKKHIILNKEITLNDLIIASDKPCDLPPLFYIQPNQVTVLSFDSYGWGKTQK